MGLIGGGILVAAEGFAQDGTRPSSVPVSSLTSTPDGYSATRGHIPSSSKRSASARSRRLSNAADGQLVLRLEWQLGQVRETSKKDYTSLEGVLSLKAATILRVTNESGGSSTPYAGERHVTQAADALPTMDTGGVGTGTPGRERNPGNPFPAEVPVLPAASSTTRVPATRGTGTSPQNATDGAAVSRDGEDEPAGPEAPVPLDSVVIGPSSKRKEASGPAGSEVSQLPDLGSSGYRLAPIAWGGTTGTSGVWSRDAIGFESLSNTQNLDVRAASYIYQPWFARISGTFGVVAAESAVGGGGSITKNSSTSFNYGGDLSLFPVSRFPFQANFNQSSNVAASQDQSITSKSTRFGLRQSYRPEQGTDTYSANYDRSLVSTGTGNSLINSAGGTYTTSFEDHSLSTNVRYSSNSGDIGGQSSQQFGVSASHSWRMDEDLMISSSANFSNNQTNILSSGVMTLNNSQLWQANTNVVWTPDQDIPLTVTGGGSLFSVQTDTGADKNQLLSLNGYATANYRFSPNLGATGSATLGQNLSSDGKGGRVSALNSTQTASVSYSGDPLKLLDFSYGWNTSGSFSNQIASGNSGQSASTQTIGGNASHSLSRAFMFSPVNSLNTYASQSYSVSKAGTSGLSNSTLSHSAGGSWRSAYSDALVGSLSVSGSDSISSGQSENHFRSFSVNGTGQWQISRRASVNASANATWSQQLTAIRVIPGESQSASSNNSPPQWSGSGSLSYSHRNPLDIQNLLYGATFSFTTSQTNLRVAAGDPDAYSWVVSNTLLQRLDYILGRVRFQLSGSLATIDNKKNVSIFFSMQRAFGDF